jgi:hypothetical protein
MSSRHRTFRALVSSGPVPSGIRYDRTMQDLLRDRVHHIDFFSIDEHGLADIPLPRQLIKDVSPKAPASFPYTSPILNGFSESHGTTGLLVWLGNNAFDRHAVEELFARPGINHPAYAQQRMLDAVDYARPALKESAQAFAYAVAHKWNIPCRAELVLADGQMARKSPDTSGALLIMTTPEHEHLLLSKIKNNLILLAARTKFDVPHNAPPVSLSVPRSR